MLEVLVSGTSPTSVMETQQVWSISDYLNSIILNKLLMMHGKCVFGSSCDDIYIQPDTRSLRFCDEGYVPSPEFCIAFAQFYPAWPCNSRGRQHGTDGGGRQSAGALCILLLVQGGKMRFED